MQNDMTIYQNKTAICRTFGIGRQTMYRYEAGIREQIAQGRDQKVSSSFIYSTGAFVL